MAGSKKTPQPAAGHGFSHLTEMGAARMVDVSGKASTHREAEAKGEIALGARITEAILAQAVEKGDVLSVARVAGIMAAKKASLAIPLCHPISMTGCRLDLDIDAERRVLTATCLVSTDGQTGVEMEALCGVSGALLAVYDMCKALGKGMVIGPIWLSEKSGGKSGPFRAEGPRG
ncbi:MAG: cyclic pyranopterin monophosphate synthase MoaC [Deltaproteobacteria bacterium]|nr:cyclic pyranopterin monophosphate synthase MoaC [Deltaproteobacteria bacterium]